MTGAAASTLPWGNTRVERFWCARDAVIHDDDGFLHDPTGQWGAARNPNVVTVDVLRKPRCVVIVGEPGSGKSETLRLHGPLLPPGVEAAVPAVHLDLAEFGTEDRLARALFDHPTVHAWRATAGGELCVVLDSLDECKERVAHVATVLGAEFERWPTDRLFLRICSRTADWPESLQPVLERLFPDASVFELLPLRRLDVEHLAEQAGVPDGAAFIAAVSSARLGPFAAKPLTLALLLRLYLRNGRLPADTTEVYRSALLLLADEPSAGRRDAAEAGRLTADERLAVAGRLAALSVFGQFSAFWLGTAADTPDTALAVHDCTGVGQDVAATNAAVRDTLRSGLFTSRGASLAGWAHKTFAEHLAARFLAARRVRGKQLRDLLLAPDRHVYPQLRPVAAWLIALHRGEYDWLAGEDPELLVVSPVDVSRPAVREQVVHALFARAAAGEFTQRFGQRFNGLDYPGLESKVRSHLFAGSAEERRLALDLAHDCVLSGLRSDLVRLALDDTEDYRLRVAAGHALTAIADVAPTAELKAIALSPTADDDPDDELKGIALRLSWPHVVTTQEVFPALTPPRNRNLFGAYSGFMSHDLPSGLTPADAEAALDWLLAIERSGARHDRLDPLADNVVTVALDALDDPRVVRRLGELLVLRANNHEPLFVDRIFRNDKRELSASQRHTLIDAVLPLVTPERAIDLVDFTQYGPGLVTGADLRWLIERFDVTRDHRDTLARLVESIFHPDVPGHAQIALELPDTHELRVGALSYWFEPVNLTSEAAQTARDRWRTVPGDDDEPAEPPSNDESIEAPITSCLDTLDAGDPTGFWQAYYLLKVAPGASAVQNELDPDITAQPRWAALDEPMQSRVVDAAGHYLRIGSCDPQEWLGRNIVYRPAWAGYGALLLLLHRDPAALAALPPEVWRRWAPIILALPAGWKAGKWDDKRTLLQHARDPAADKLLETAIALVEGASDAGEAMHLSRELAEIWSPRLSSWLREALSGNRLNDANAPPVRELLMEKDPQEARPILRDMLTGDAEGDERAHVGALLLAHDASESWPLLVAEIDKDPELGERLICAYLNGGGHHDQLPALADRDLAELYLWLLRRFPFEDDPQFDDAHIVGSREQAGHFRDRILRALQKRGTAESVAAISAIEQALPQHTWLRAVRREAELEMRANSWMPVAPDALLSLIGEAGARLVTTAAQLCDVVLDAIAVIQARLTGETPESHLLWDTRVGRPKQEDDISDYLLHRLRDLIADRGVVVNREVQVRRSGAGIGERTDLRIDAVTPAETNGAVLSLVVEVKGAWHRQLMESMHDQLADRYMRDVGTDHGIYLVAWPDVASWRSDDDDRRRVEGRPRADTQAELVRRAAELGRTGRRIAVVALDMAWGRPIVPT